MNPNSISCPKSYQKYLDDRAPFYRGSIRATQAVADFILADTVVANYDGSQFVLTDTRGVTQIFEWYVDPPPVFVPGILYINLTGLLTLTQIVTATIAQIDGFAAGYAVRYSGAGGAFTVVQERPGSRGNTVIGTSGGVNYTINGFNVSDSNAYFYGGQDLLVPILWGPQRGMGLTTSRTIRGEASE